jgi:putative FmdB family regulatory protein
MPSYDYACDRCGHIGEEFFKLAEKPDTIPCGCGGVKKSIITLGHGGIWRVEPVWLNGNVRETLQDSDAIRAKLQKPIIDRDDYNRFMKANPHIQPV